LELDRLKQTHAAVKAIKGGPDGAGAWFSAYALCLSGDSPANLAGALETSHVALKDALGSWQAPTGSLRWIYAALLTGNGKTASDFVTLRTTLKESAKEAGTGKLYAGGSRAALVLTLSGARSASALRRFLAIQKAIQPPWWRANQAITDQFAASHAAQDDSPDSVVRAREAALAVFAGAKATRGLKREGARLCALYRQPAREVAERFVALRAAARELKPIRQTGNRHLYMEWAAQGVTSADLPVIASHMQALDAVTQTGSARLRLAQLVWLGERGDGGLGTVSAMSAVIAAQTAAIIAASTAMSAAVTTTSGP